MPTKLEKKDYFDASCSEISRDSDAKAQRADVQNPLKNTMFWTIFYILANGNAAVRHVKKIIKRQGK